MALATVVLEGGHGESGRASGASCSTDLVTTDLFTTDLVSTDLVNETPTPPPPPPPPTTPTATATATAMAMATVTRVWTVTDTWTPTTPTEREGEGGGEYAAAGYHLTTRLLARRMMVRLCLFHALVQERSRFGPIGWSANYSFTLNDFQLASSHLLSDLAERVSGEATASNGGTLPTELLVRDVVYGGQTHGHEGDSACMQTLIGACFRMRGGGGGDETSGFGPSNGFGGSGAASATGGAFGGGGDAAYGGSEYGDGPMGQSNAVGDRSVGSHTIISSLVSEMDEAVGRLYDLSTGLGDGDGGGDGDDGDGEGEGEGGDEVGAGEGNGGVQPLRSILELLPAESDHQHADGHEAAATGPGAGAAVADNASVGRDQAHGLAADASRESFRTQGSFQNLAMASMNTLERQPSAKSLSSEGGDSRTGGGSSTGGAGSSYGPAASRLAGGEAHSAPKAAASTAAAPLSRLADRSLAECCGLHPNANASIHTSRGESLLATLAVLNDRGEDASHQAQGLSARLGLGGAGFGSSPRPSVGHLKKLASFGTANLEGAGDSSLPRSVLGRLPSPIDTRDDSRLRPGDCLRVSVMNECAAYNRLIARCSEDCRELSEALLGKQVSSAALEALHATLANNLVPEQWRRCSYPTDESVSLERWLDELSTRVQYVREWRERGNPAAFCIPTL